MVTYICDHADPEFSCYGCPHSVPHDKYEYEIKGCDHLTFCSEICVNVQCVEWENDDD
jgi:hypothetical protein